MTAVVALPGESAVSIRNRNAWPIHDDPAIAPVHGRALSKAFRAIPCSSSALTRTRTASGGPGHCGGFRVSPTVEGRSTRSHGVGVPNRPGTVPGTDDESGPSRQTRVMQYAAIALATIVPVALGLLVIARGAQRRIGWLLVAHGAS